MKVLTFSTLYPNLAQPQRGVFVENRVRRLVEAGAIEVRVLAPVPWFPFALQCFGHYADFARVRASEERYGIGILHPTYPVIPKVGMTLAPALMYASMRRAVSRILSSGFDFDLIDAHYFYPDGVAAAMLARQFKRPLVITARGSDINLISRYRWPRRMIRWAAQNATSIVAVSQALKDELARLGIDARKVCVLRNGVDLDAFRPLERDSVRAQFGFEAPILLMVGNLVPLKGHDLAIRALPSFPKATLLIAGEGPQEPALRSLVSRLGLVERVHFLGAIRHTRLHETYNAADILLLPSASEGMPNVLLEAMACGVPVIASDTGGSSEVVSVGQSGMLLPVRTPEAIAEAVRALLARPFDRAKVREHAEQYSWEPTTKGQLRLFEQAVKKAQRNS